MSSRKSPQRGVFLAGRDLMSKSLEDVCESCCDDETEPGVVYTRLGEITGSMESPDTNVDQNTYGPLYQVASLALHQILASGWPSVRLLRSLLASIARLAESTKAPACMDVMEEDMHQEEGHQANFDDRFIDNLLSSLWMLCQLLKSMDEVFGLLCTAS